MRPSRVVVNARMLDDHLGFPEATEDFGVQQLVPELAVEGPALAVLPR